MQKWELHKFQNRNEVFETKTILFLFLAKIAEREWKRDFSFWAEFAQETTREGGNRNTLSVHNLVDFLIVWCSLFVLVFSLPQN